MCACVRSQLVYLTERKKYELSEQKIKTLLKILVTAHNIALISQILFFPFAFAVVSAAVNNAAKSHFFLTKLKDNFIVLFWLKQPGEAQYRTNV